MKLPAFLCLSCLALSSCGAAASPADLCETTVRDYAVLRDNGPAQSYAELFTPGGTFTLGPNVTEGREALTARHKASNEAALWRHNMLDVRITETEGKYTGRSRFMIYTAPHPAPAANPREIIGDYVDVFKIESGRCYIQSRGVEIIFDTKPAG